MDLAMTVLIWAMAILALQIAGLIAVFLIVEIHSMIRGSGEDEESDESETK